MGACVGPTCNTRLLPPPPSPPVPVSLPQWLWVTGKGTGLLLVSSRLIHSSKGFPGLWSSNITRPLVTSDGSPLTIGERPCKCAGVRDNVLGGNRGGWGMGGGGLEPERGGMSGGRGIICKSKFLASLLSWEKTMRPLYLNLHTHSTLPAFCNNYRLMIRSSLKDWQSMKKVHTCVAKWWYSEVKVHHRYQRHWRQICHRYQRHRRQILPPFLLVLLIPVANL